MSYWDTLSRNTTDIREVADQIIALKVQKIQQGLTTPSEREKFQWQQTMDMRRDRQDRIKFMAGKAIEHSRSLTTGIERKHYWEKAQAWIGGLDPEMQNFVRSSMDLSPLSDSQKKILDYRSSHPRPEVTADWETDPNAYAQQKFAQEEDNFQMRAFIGEQDVKRKDTFMAPDGTYVYKNPENGLMTQMTREALAQMPALKKANMTPEQAVAAGGMIPLEDFSSHEDGQNKFLMRPVTNMYTGAKEIEKIRIGAAETPAPRSAPEEVQDFMAMLGWDEDDLDAKHEMTPVVREYHRRRTPLKRDKFASDREYKAAINKALEQSIGTFAPGWNFAVKDPDPDIEKDWFWSEYNEATEEYIVSWPGVRKLIPGAEGTFVPVWYDATTGHYYFMGQFLGTEEDAAAWASLKRGKKPGRAR